MTLVTVRFIGYLANIAGQREFSLELTDATLSGALSALNRATAGRMSAQLYQEIEPQQLNKNNLFLINGTEARFRAGLQTTLEDGSVISIIPPIVGG